MSESDLPDVYDLFYPSPPRLEELTSIQLALDLWRQEIIKHRANGTIYDLDLLSALPLSSHLSSNLPAKLLPRIEKYAKKLGSSIRSWLYNHIVKVSLKYEVLNDFLDFVCDFDGGIHFDRTAKRLILCDAISDEVKFKVACWYSFEEEIFKIWPSVSSLQDWSKTSWNQCAKTFYWICKLKNQTYKIPRRLNGMDMFDDVSRYEYDKKILPTWSSFEYFWNLLDSDQRSQKLLQFFKPGCVRVIHCRFLFQRLIEADQRAVFLQRDYQGKSMITRLLDSTEGFQAVLKIWWYIKSFISEADFIELVRFILETEANTDIHLSAEDTSLWCEIWATAPDHLKLAISSILSEGSFLVKKDELSLRFNSINFLVTILVECPIEDRRTFWEKNWRNLIIYKRVKDLRVLAKLCFSEQSDFEEFKAAELSNFENIKSHCVHLLENGCFSELDQFLQFCCADEHAIKEMKLQLLAENFQLTTMLIEEANSFSEFIDETYSPDMNLANTYKSELLSRDCITKCINECILKGCFQKLMQFVDIFAVLQKNANEFKKSMIMPLVQTFFKTNYFHDLSPIAGDDLSMFMSWLLYDDDESAQFKLALPIDWIVQNQIRSQMQRNRKEIQNNDLGCRVRSPPAYNYFFVKFLEWYFVDEEALKELKVKYADDEIFEQLITK